MCLQIRNKGYQKKSFDLLKAIQKVINSYDLPWTVRQIHYNLVGMGVIVNTTAQYRKVSRLLTDGRYTGHVPWNKITDDTRGAYKTTSWNSIEDGVNSFLDRFRLKGRWIENNRRIEVWVEKRTLRRLCYPITDKYDVYLAVGAGWNSTSAIWDAVERILAYDTKRLDILYFGDLDPSGDDMPRDVEDRLTEFIGITGKIGNKDIHFPDEIHVHKILINDEDVDKYKLQRKFDVPVLRNNEVHNKIADDPRALGFYQKHGELFQVEMEALDPKTIVDVLEDSLLQYVDVKKFEHVQKQEDEERERIRKLII